MSILGLTIFYRIIAQPMIFVECHRLSEWVKRIHEQ